MNNENSYCTIMTFDKRFYTWYQGVEVLYTWCQGSDAWCTWCQGCD